MASQDWPKQGTAALLGSEQDRIEGLEKATGTAKYAYDINPAGVLLARALGSPHAHCRIKSIDTSAASKVRGVVDVDSLNERPYKSLPLGDF